MSEGDESDWQTMTPNMYGYTSGENSSQGTTVNVVITNESETEDLVIPAGTTLGWVECVSQVEATDALDDLEEEDKD